MIPSPRITPILTFAFVSAIFATGIFLFARNQLQPPAPQPKEVVFTASIAPLANIARNIAGNTADVFQLIPANASPHSYTPTPQDIAALQGSRALFIIGHNLDDWSAKPAAASADVPVVVVDTNIPLREFGEIDSHEDEDEELDDHGHEEGSVDPHYWLTVPNAKIIAQNVTRTMSEKDPVHADTYQRNLDTYVQKLDMLETSLQEQAEAIEQKNFITMHDAWSYFAEQYGFTLVDTYEPLEGREPSVSDLNELQEIIETYDIRTFYAEPQKVSTSAAQFMAKEFGLTITALDPVGGIVNRDSYIEIMQFNMKQLAE